MATTTTPNLNLTLAIPGSNEPFDTNMVNTNFTAIDTWVGAPSLSKSTMRVTGTGGVSLITTGHPFQIGPSTAQNVAMGTNQIQSRNNGAKSELQLNRSGGAVAIGNMYFEQIVPTSAGVAGGGSATIDADDKVTLSGVGSVRLTSLFDASAGANSNSVFEFFWYMTDSPAPGSSQPLFLGLASDATFRTTLRSVYRGFSDATSGTMTFGGSSTDSQDCNIGMTGNVAITGAVIHGYVYHALSAGERTKIIVDAISDQDSLSRWDAVVYNSVSQVDNGLRLGRGGTGTVSGQFYCRRIS